MLSFPPPATHSLHQLKLPSPSSAGSSPAGSSTQGTPTTVRKTPTLATTTPIASGATSTTPSPNRTALKPTPLSPTAQQRLATRQQSLSAVYDYTIGSQEMIVEKAKQVSYIKCNVKLLNLPPCNVITFVYSGWSHALAIHVQTSFFRIMFQQGWKNNYFPASKSEFPSSLTIFPSSMA